MKLLIMGPPGVGKGTQARILAKNLEVFHLSTGEILRKEIKNKTKIGKIAKSFIDHGNLVPDDIILDIITKKILTEETNNGYLLDGFPRTIPQATGFDKILKKMEHNLNAAINLIADENELINRIINRGKISGRSDDTYKIIQERQKIYWKQTAPLIDYYDKKKILKNIDGIGRIEDITKRILQALK
jgi:adenylate kinase